MNAYFERELSWLEFNRRVLEEGLSAGIPLLERLRFMSIVSSNFDEFFMVRVAALKSAIADGAAPGEGSGMSPERKLEAVGARCRELVGMQYRALTTEILSGLEGEGLVLRRPGAWDSLLYRFLEDYHERELAGTLSPLAVPEDEGAFPSTGNLRIHVAFLLRPIPSSPTEIVPEGGERIGIVQVPPNLDRFVHVPSEDGRTVFVLLEDIVMAFGHRFFPGYEASERLVFKVTRDADIGVDEDRDDDFVNAMEEVLVNRQNSRPVRLSVSADSERLASMVSARLGLSPADVYVFPGPIDLKGFMELANVKGFDRLRYEPWVPAETLDLSGDVTVWDHIRKKDILLHVPYESFAPVVAFIEQAAADPRVLAIKMTLYRTSGDSPIVKALSAAALSGKQVTAIVELKARFDEERNIAWAARLEQAGAIVVYGAARLKVHAKAIIVVRRDEDGIVRRYAHAGTGNYNDRTARLYADLSVFTANEAICYGLGQFFNAITGLSSTHDLGLLSMAPYDLKRRLIELVRREAARSTHAAPGLIMAKMNALCDRDIIDELYAASRAGVRVRLNVRGICQLVPGVKGMSENIEVVSVVGRFLEHSRIFYFRNGGAHDIFLASADWMTRNLDRRVELMFPILDPDLGEEAFGILSEYFRDNAKAWRLEASGAWNRAKRIPGEPEFSAQGYFRERVRKAADEGTGVDRAIRVRRRPS